MARVNVKVYGGLTELTGGRKEIEVDSSSIRGIMGNLSQLFGPSFGERVLNPQGELETFIRIFVNNKDIRFLKGLDTEVQEGDDILVMPAIGGG